MKKIFITMILFGTVISPVFAVCSITGGACSVLNSPGLNEKYIPNNLENIQKPDAFAPQYFQPYQNILINTERNNTTATGAAANSNYNSNCQFGVCLPGQEITDIPMEY